MTIRLVVADDHPIVLEGVVSLIEREPDLEVATRCADGEATLQAVQACRPDILVLDLRMPRLDGRDVLRRLARDGLEVRTVLLTAGATDEELLDAVRLGARGVLFKDSAPELLTRCVRAVHAGGQWLEQQLIGRVLEQRVAREVGGQRLAQALSRREAELAALVCEGLRNKEVAVRLGNAEGTVKIHLYRIYDKLGVGSRLELANLVRAASE